jgi:Uri superfamily endonuclease
MLAQIPAQSGTYVLVLHLPQDRVIAVGRMGPIAFRRGYYLYVGSARGPGGLRARLGRHMRRGKSVHWHIDYLRPWAEPVEAWLSLSSEQLECRWSICLQEAGLAQPVRGFGASDCPCDTHLLYSPTRPAATCRRTLEQAAGPPLVQLELTGK